MFPLDPDKLNADCACISLDRAALCRELDALTGEPGYGLKLAASHPNLFANLPVYLKPEHIARMAAIIRAIEATANLPAYQEAALATAPAIARFEPKAHGVLMGYDFHLSDDGSKLIEINTNAGGALINAVLSKAQRACCAAVIPMLSGIASADDAEAAILQSFIDDWTREQGVAPLKTIAIVDETPEKQFLYPEFLLAQRLFARHSYAAIIVPPDHLSYDGETLDYNGLRIDLVYNRLTDFYLEQPSSAALRAAYLARHAVLTPHPRAHALLANKRNLTKLTDRANLTAWGVPDDTITILEGGIPKTIEVTRTNASTLWDNRSAYFFKPHAGYGSKAAYRGDKITRRVWDSVASGGYVAQALVPPSTRAIVIDGERQSLKADLRCYTYNGKILLTAARLYQGQTTNMRTPGGGFAPVFSGELFSATGCCTSPGSDQTCC